MGNNALPRVGVTEALAVDDLLGPWYGSLEELARLVAGDLSRLRAEQARPRDAVPVPGYLVGIASLLLRVLAERAESAP